MQCKYKYKMAIKSNASFQNKLIKTLLLSILIPGLIILFSAWFFFGDIWKSPDKKTITTITPTPNGNVNSGITNGT